VDWSELRRVRVFGLLVVVLVLVAVAAAAREGWIRTPGASRHADLAAQMRDRALVAVVGDTPWGLSVGGTPLVSAERDAPLRDALAGRDPAAVAARYRASHLDGLLVRTDRVQGPPGSVARTLSAMQAVDALGAVYLDDTAAVYETREPFVLTPEEGHQLIEVARLVLSGAVAPPERIFSEALRKTRPTEVALILRDGREAVLWRSTRGGSVARAFLDVCFAVLDRWTSRQQERYGRMRQALDTLSLTLAVFYDKGVLGQRSPAFLNRAADPRVWAVGYERLATWEYALPPTPWSPAPDPTTALRNLTRERGVPAPGHLRPELTLYRYRAFQVIETSPSGPVQCFDPHP
jgi:hypothetical protein